MSNLLKRGTTVSKDERVIDYNEIIRAKLSSYMENTEPQMDPDGFINGLQADVVESLISDDEEINEEDLAAKQEAVNRQIAASLENANEEARQIVSDATEEANQVLANANKEAERVIEEARNRGYSEGSMKAEEELNKRLADMENEYKSKAEALDREYQELKASIEPELVDVITDIFRKVTKTVAEDNQEIILHLINDVLRKSEGSREFTIKVSPDDYNFMINNQGKLYCAMSKEVNIDIYEDNSLKRNECIIETKTGVFNCSLDIELNNLIRDIKLLSCM